MARRASCSPTRLTQACASSWTCHGARRSASASSWTRHCRVNERIAAALQVLPEYLGQHVILSAAALALGLALSVPLAIGASRSARLRWPVLAFASLVQTIPSLALLAL